MITKDLFENSSSHLSHLSEQLNVRLWDLVARNLPKLSDTRIYFAKDCGASGMDMIHVLILLLQRLSVKEISELRETLIIPELIHLLSPATVS